MRDPRGYILMEVAIAGALVAVIAGTLLSSLADARVRNVMAGRDVVASQLALEKIEQQRALGFAGAGAAAACGTEATVAGQKGAYSRTCAVAVSAGSPFTINTVTVNCKDVTVTVKYNVDAAARSTSANGDRTVTLQTRVCS